MISDKQKHCPECSAVIPRIAEFCPRCDAPQLIAALAQSTPNLARNVTPRPRRDRLAAALLGIFVGGFGVHHFYLRNYIRGFFYLIFAWTFVPTIIGFIEGVLYLFMDNDAFDWRYNR